MHSKHGELSLRRYGAIPGAMALKAELCEYTELSTGLKGGWLPGSSLCSSVNSLS